MSDQTATSKRSLMSGLLLALLLWEACVGRHLERTSVSKQAEPGRWAKDLLLSKGHQLTTTQPNLSALSLQPETETRGWREPER